MKNNRRSLTYYRLDQAGAFLSSACALHCLTLPLLVVALPWLGFGFLLDRKLELLFIAGSLSLATISFCLGYHLHREVRLLLALYLCTGMIVLGKVFVGGSTGLWLAVPGALGLAAGHFFNRRLCHQFETCHDVPTERG